MTYRALKDYVCALNRDSSYYQLDDPANYYRSGDLRIRLADIPERSLVRAVLANALESYIKYQSAAKPRGQRLFREAEAWFFEPDDGWYLSFENVCEILALDPDYIRHGLRQYAQRHSIKTNLCANGHLS